MLRTWGFGCDSTMIGFATFCGRPGLPLRLSQLQALQVGRRSRNGLKTPVWQATKVRCMVTSKPAETNSRTAVSSLVEDSESSMFAAGMSFKELGVSSDISEHLSATGITTPTKAQAAVIPLLIEGIEKQTDYALRVLETENTSFDEDEHRNSITDSLPESGSPDTSRHPSPPEDDLYDVMMFGAETGSGKTLAYLLPYVEAAKATDLELKAVVLVPSRELCWQVANFLQDYFPNAPPHIVLSGGQPPDAASARGVRLVIATPTALLNYFRFSSKADASDKVIIVDEADMLLSGSFLRDVEKILDQPGMKPFATRKNKQLRKRNRNRLVFVGATYPHWTGEKVKSIVTWMKRRYPGVKAVQTMDIHRKSDKVVSDWRFLDSEAERIESLVDVLRKCAPGEKVMVFANKAETCARVCEVTTGMLGGAFVEDVFGEAVQLHKHVHAEERKEGLVRFRKGQAGLLFCTDLGARGLDLGEVSCVIEFEFSTNVVGYLHRIGRTARAGATGRTVHFYDKVAEPLADAIRQRTEKEDTVVEGVFSRNRSFRRKLKKKMTVVEGLESVTIDPADAEEKERYEG